MGVGEEVSKGAPLPHLACANAGMIESIDVNPFVGLLESRKFISDCYLEMRLSMPRRCQRR
jgi:hypothetical protein